MWITYRGQRCIVCSRGACYHIQRRGYTVCLHSHPEPVRMSASIWSSYQCEWMSWFTEWMSWVECVIYCEWMSWDSDWMSWVSVWFSVCELLSVWMIEYVCVCLCVNDWLSVWLCVCVNEWMWVIDSLWEEIKTVLFII